MKRVSMRRGFTALEVLMGSMVLASGLLVVMALAFRTGREAGFSEGHLLAHARVQVLLDAQEALGWSALASADTGGVELPVPAAAIPATSLPGLTGAQGYAEKLTVRSVADGLVCLSAEVSWTFAGDRPERRKTHTVRSLRFVARPDASWLHGYPTRPGGPA
jgi:hypothetical protein